MLKFIANVASNLFRAPRTEAFPFGDAQTPRAYRGRVEVDETKCVGCSTCAQVCACEAIRLEEEEDGVRLIVWHSHCAFCGLCEFYCPTDAIRLSNDWDLSHPNSEKYLMQENILALYQTCTDCGAKLMVPNQGVLHAAQVGKVRGDQTENPKCDACRRKEKARQIIGAT